MAGLGSGQSDPIHGTQEAAERARVAARQSAAWLRDEAGRLYSSYQQQSKFFKWRAWIVASFALVSLVSLAKAMGPSNSINAHVGLAREPMTNALLTAVTNESTDDWTNVKLIMNDTYEFEKDRLGPGQNVNPPVTQYQNPKVKGPAGKAPANIELKKLRVECSQGSFEQEFN